MGWSFWILKGPLFQVWVVQSLGKVYFYTFLLSWNTYLKHLLALLIPHYAHFLYICSRISLQISDITTLPTIPSLNTIGETKSQRSIWGCWLFTGQACLRGWLPATQAAWPLHPAVVARVAEAAYYKATAHRLIMSFGFLSRPGMPVTANAGNFKRSRAVDNKTHSGMFLTKQSRIQHFLGVRTKMEHDQHHLSNLARLFWLMRNGLKIIPGPHSTGVFVIYLLCFVFEKNIFICAESFLSFVFIESFILKTSKWLLPFPRTEGQVFSGGKWQDGL